MNMASFRRLTLNFAPLKLRLRECSLLALAKRPKTFPTL
jgi:hypothetical protein